MADFKRVLSIFIIGLLIAITFFPIINQPTAASAGVEWNQMPNSFTQYLSDVWVNSCSDAFAVGSEGLIVHFNGTSWSAMNSNTTNTLYAVWSCSPGCAFAAGEYAGGSSTILRYSGSAWATMTNPGTQDLYDVWGSSANDVFVVGDSGLIMHWNGTAWSVMTSGTGVTLRSIYGTSSSNVFAVGNSGTILHYNGTSWSSMTSGTSNTLMGVWCSSASSVWAVGTADLILHYNGSTWIPSASGTGSTGYAIWGTSDSNIYVLFGATLCAYNGSTWRAMTGDFSDVELYSLSGACANDVFSVGAGTLYPAGIMHYGGGCCANSCISSSVLNTNLGAVSLNSTGCCVGSAIWIEPGSSRCSSPASCIFPYGLFSFDAGTVASGQTGRITIQLPNSIPAGSRYYICNNNIMTDISSQASLVDARTVLLTLSSGGSYTIGICFAQSTTPQSSSPWLPETSKAPVQLSNIGVKTASLSSSKVAPGEHVTVTANVANTGTGNGTSVIKVYVNGQEESQQGIAVNSGGLTTVTFDVSRNEPGIYSVYVGSMQAGSFTVEQFTPNTILFISGVLVFFALVGGVIWMAIRRKV